MVVQVLPGTSRTGRKSRIGNNAPRWRRIATPGWAGITVFIAYSGLEKVKTIANHSLNIWMASHPPLERANARSETFELVVIFSEIL